MDWFKENTPLYGDYVLPIIGLEVADEKLDDYLMQVRKRFNASLKSMIETGLVIDALQTIVKDLLTISNTIIAYFLQC